VGQGRHVQVVRFAVFKPCRGKVSACLLGRGWEAPFQAGIELRSDSSAGLKHLMARQCMTRAAGESGCSMLGAGWICGGKWKGGSCLTAQGKAHLGRHGMHALGLTPGSSAHPRQVGQDSLGRAARASIYYAHHRTSGRDPRRTACPRFILPDSWSSGGSWSETVGSAVLLNVSRRRHR
jgi:hypothetical protein